MHRDSGRDSTLSRRRPLASLLALAILATPVLARDDASEPEPEPPPSFSEQITVTATGDEQRVEDLPVSVTVIGRQEIADSQEDSVADLVRRSPGVTVMRTGDQGGSASFFVRGTESDHVLALFDGVRLNSPYFAGYDWSLQASTGIERIEVARGPFSALWGSDAVGGVVNVIPARGGDQTQIRLVGEAGSDDWQRFQGTLGLGSDDWDLYASAYDREGRGELPNSDFANRQLLFDAGYSWSDGSRAAVLYQNLDSELGLPFSTPGNLTPNRRQDAVQEILALPLYVQSGGGWNLELIPSLVERELEFRDPDDAFGFVRSDTFADTLQVRVTSRHLLAAGGGPGRHELSWGGEWREDEVDSRSSFGTDLDSEVVRLTGLFTQDVWRPSERLTVLLGVRYDDTDEWGSEISPRLSLGYRATAAVEVRASYGEAFRQPAVGELFFPFSGNPDLEPERSQSAELGLRASLGKHRINSALFSTDTEEMIDFDFATFSFANIAQVEIRGAELAWTAPITGAFESTLSTTWLDTEDEQGRPLLRRPEWSASWTLNGRLAERLRGDLAVYFVGERADVDAVTFGRTEIGSYVTANLALAYRVVGGLEITARVTNLADREYDEVDGYPAPGRRLLGGLRWTR